MSKALRIILQKRTLLCLLGIVMVVYVATSLFSAHLIGQVHAAEEILYRVNAGGGKITATPNWTADTQSAPSPYVNAAQTGNLLGSTTASINMSHSSIATTGVPSSVFKTYRMDSASTAAQLKYTFPAAPGEYQIRLYFAETNSANFNVGARTFDVLVEDGLLENGLDVFKVAGAGNKAIMRNYYTTVLDGNLTIEFGNKIKNPFVSAIEIIKVDMPGTWKGLMPTDTARDEASFTQLNGKIYLAGGNINLTTVTDQQEYDPVTNTWRPVAPLPEALNHIQSVAYNGKIYYIGGLNVWPGPESNNVYIYDPLTDTFSEGASMPRPRGAGGTTVYNNKIYYAGGLNNGVAVNWFDEYDPSTNTWRQMPNLPTKKDHFHTAVLGDKLYAIAGRNLDAGALINENVAFDFIQNQWITGLAPAPTARGGFATAVVGNEVIVLGGERRMPNLALNSVEAYNTTTNTWRVLAPMPLPNHGISATECNGGIYIANGSKIGGDKGTHNTVNAFFLNDQITPCPTTETRARPTVTVNITPSILNKGEQFVLSWTSTNADSCIGKNIGYWGGSKPLNGSETFTANNNNTYTLTCTGSGGTAKASAKVTVIQPTS